MIRNDEQGGFSVRLVRLERQQSRVADDVRAALASLGRGSTVIGGIALIGVGTVTDRPIEAVVLLPHGVIIVIGVDLPDPALRLEAPLGAEWKADGWPLVADDDAVNPATEALDLSQACESRIVELVPGTAPVGTIVAVGPYVETVDQPASDLAGPVRVLHPTPTTMLAATVSLATAHRPRSVDQVRALIHGLAPDAPEFSDEVLLGEGFSRFSDDTPPESLWDTAPRVPSQVPGTPARGLADWRTETPSAPSATGKTQIAESAGSGLAEGPGAVGIPKSPEPGNQADSAPMETSTAVPDTSAAPGAANSAEAGDSAASPPAQSLAATGSAEPSGPAESAVAPNAAAMLRTTDPAEAGPERPSAGAPEPAEPTDTGATRSLAVAPGTTESTEPSVPAESAPAAAVAHRTTEPTLPTETGAAKTPGTTESADPSFPADSAPAPAVAPNTAAALRATKPAEPTDTGAARSLAVTPGTAEPATAPADAGPAWTPTQAPGTTEPAATSTPARTAAAPNSASAPGTTESAEPGPADTPDFADSERTETLGKPATVRPLFPGAEQIPPYRAPADTERTETLDPAGDTERTETLPHPGPPGPVPMPAAPLPRQEAPSFRHPRENPVPRPAPEPAAPTSRTVRWLPLGAIGLLVALVVAAVVVATSGDDTTATPATQAPATKPPPSPQPTTGAPAQSLQFALRAADGDQRCASHAFGDAQASLQQTSCSGVRRASYATTVDGRAGAVTIGIVAFPDAAQAAAFKAIADTPGGGGILDLAAETGKWGNPAPRFENAAYTSKLEGTSVRLVQAVWVPGPSTPDDPGLARAAKAALDLPAQ